MITATRRRPGSPQSVLVNEPDMHGTNLKKAQRSAALIYAHFKKEIKIRS